MADAPADLTLKDGLPEAALGGFTGFWVGGRAALPNNPIYSIWMCARVSPYTCMFVGVYTHTYMYTLRAS